MLVRASTAQLLRSVDLLVVGLPEPTIRALEAAGAIVHSQDVGRESMAQLILLRSDLKGPEPFARIAAWRSRSEAPILVLTLGSREADRIQALAVGADQVVNAACSPDELVARVEAALRRRTLSHPAASRLRFVELEIDLVARRFFLEGEETKLSRREHDLLCCLARHAGRPIGYRQIIDAVWGPGAPIESQYVRVLVGQLRQRLEADPARPRLLVTEAGFGYRLAVSPLTG